jgi:hypothetical protein
MQFSKIVRGKRQDEVVDLPPYIGQPEDVPPIKSAVRALDALEEERALEAAAARAKSKGAKSEPGDPIYDFALMVETIAIGYCDSESPPEARRPIFDGGPDQVREFFGREAITLLYEMQQDYQDKVAPTLKKLSPVEFYVGIQTLGGESEEEARRFFVRCNVGLRWTFMRSTALHLLSSLTHNSEPGSKSEETLKNA